MKIWKAFILSFNNAMFKNEKDGDLFFVASTTVAAKMEEVLEQYGKTIQYIGKDKNGLSYWKVNTLWEGFPKEVRNKFWEDYKSNIPLLNHLEK